MNAPRRIARSGTGGTAAPVGKATATSKTSGAFFPKGGCKDQWGKPAGKGFKVPKD